MTLGLFPAVAIGLAWETLRETFLGPLGRGLLIISASLLLISAVPRIVDRHDTLGIQRDSLDFIDRDFDKSARGFQTEGALICRSDPTPFRTYFSDAVLASFTGKAGQQNMNAFVDEFRNRPVSFLIAHRLFRFPEQIDDFWSTHYVVYRDEVMIPGRTVEGRKGDHREFDVIVPGSYNWFSDKSATRQIAIDQHPIESARSIPLTKGNHELTLLEDVHRATIALAVKDEPLPPGPPFYDPQAIRELDPLYNPAFGPSIPSVR